MCSERLVQKSLTKGSAERLLLRNRSASFSTSSLSSWCRRFTLDPCRSYTALWSWSSRSILSHFARHCWASEFVRFVNDWSVCLRSKTSTSRADSSFSTRPVTAALNSSVPEASRDACSPRATLTARVASPCVALSSALAFFSSITCDLSSSTWRARNCCSWTSAAWSSWIWSRSPFRSENADSKGLLPFWDMAGHGQQGKTAREC
mmetsp:Transcript_77594/g.219393  ORF Transcript_77594/g.219393 Transcript_77594/m.219393 type:complete len:206 (-) Transcript_77594:28-645(-)